MIGFCDDDKQTNAMPDLPNHHEPEGLPYQWYPSLHTEGYQSWPEFCQWLASQGLCVFFNLLEDESATTLHWQWGELHGQGAYTTCKEAIIAALDCKLNRRPSAPDRPLLPRTGASPDTRKGRRRRWPTQWSKRPDRRNH